MGSDGRAERPLLRRVGHARGDAARHLDAGALPQGGGDAQGRGRAARRRLRAATVKILTSCPSCLQGLSRYDDDAGTRGRLHRRRDGAARARARLDAATTSPRRTRAASSACWSDGRAPRGGDRPAVRRGSRAAPRGPVTTAGTCGRRHRVRTGPRCASPGPHSGGGTTYRVAIPSRSREFARPGVEFHEWADERRPQGAVR